MQVVRNLGRQRPEVYRARRGGGQLQIVGAMATPCLSSVRSGIPAVGIPEDRQIELFQVFSQIIESARTKRFGGTGLGLAISRRLVEMMGGTVSVFSRAGQGTFSFTVSLRPPQEDATFGKTPAGRRRRRLVASPA